MRRKRKIGTSKQHPYKTEAELCTAFSELVERLGFTVYPECGNFDLLLVKDNDQIGVEAKLRTCFEVLDQVLPKYRVTTNYIGVLVPVASAAFTTVCRHLHVHVWTHSWIQSMNSILEYATEDTKDRCRDFLRQGWRQEPEKPVVLPAVPLQGPGGCPSPRVMSKWREAALKLCVLMETQGFLTQKDIKSYGVSPTLWTQKWLKETGKIDGDQGRKICTYTWSNKDRTPSTGYEKELEVTKELLSKKE